MQILFPSVAVYLLVNAVPSLGLMSKTRVFVWFPVMQAASRFAPGLGSAGSGQELMMIGYFLIQHNLIFSYKLSPLTSFCAKKLHIRYCTQQQENVLPPGHGFLVST